MSKALIPLGLIGVAGVMGSLAGGQGNKGRRALPACATPGYNDDGIYGVITYNGFAGINEADRFAKEVREDKRHYVSGVYLANGKWSVDVKRYYHAPPAGRGRRASDEDRVARMDAITESVGVRAQATLQGMKDEARWQQRRARSIEWAWSNWDWGELHFYGLINKADFAFVEEFLGDYTYDI